MDSIYNCGCGYPLLTSVDPKKQEILIDCVNCGSQVIAYDPKGINFKVPVFN